MGPEPGATRRERDSLAAREVLANRYRGAGTQRSPLHFAIGYLGLSLKESALSSVTSPRRIAIAWWTSRRWPIPMTDLASSVGADLCARPVFRAPPRLRPCETLGCSSV